SLLFRDAGLVPHHQLSLPVNNEWETSLKAWYKITKAAKWEHLLDLRQTFPSADSVGTCIVFNINGNKCRLITRINFKWQLVYTLHVLDHAEYDNGRWKNDCDRD